jgi:hypothetical protein
VCCYWVSKESVDNINKVCEGRISCSHFKDKSLFVELPCEWGKDVYTIVKGCKRIFKTKLFAIGVTEDGYTVYNPTYNPTEYPKGVFSINGVILGENTFSTKESAEAKLKELGV